MLRVLLIFFFFVCLSPGSFATVVLQEVVNNEVNKKTVEEDTAGKIEVRKFDSEKLNKYKSDKEFSYDDSVPQEQNWFSRFWDWFWSMINSILKDERSGTFIGYVVIAALVILILYAILRFAGMDLRLLSKKSKNVEIPYQESQDNIHEINFSEEIERAVNAGNYRLAVRLSYLRTLKFLNDSDQINWQPEKTNQVYVNEISDINTKEVFKTLTQRFEYIWYGEFFLELDEYSHLKSEFDHFNRKSS
ncbi:MAG: hypothetical protein EOO92_04165 [Pedobacter sp.]|nr:MAG: hypothetical protein EOO92_04165 [Pedobacter sp.]